MQYAVALRFVPMLAYNVALCAESGPAVTKKSHTDDKQDFATFERYMAELEKLVERMEKGDQTLDQSLKDFERGVELTRACEKTLSQAEQRVEQLVKRHGEFKLEPFTPEE